MKVWRNTQGLEFDAGPFDRAWPVLRPDGTGEWVSPESMLILGYELVDASNEK